MIKKEVIVNLNEVTNKFSESKKLKSWHYKVA
jgi:hypothetical protein